MVKIIIRKKRPSRGDALPKCDRLAWKPRTEGILGLFASITGEEPRPELAARVRRQFEDKGQDKP